MSNEKYKILISDDVKNEIKNMRAPVRRKRRTRIPEDMLNPDNGKILFSNMPNWLLKFIFLRSNLRTPLLFAVLNYHVDLPAILMKQFKYLTQRKIMAKIFKDIRTHVKELRHFARKCNIHETEFPDSVSTASVDKALI
uniref:Uncharacterized protein n=1 Tax=Strigamia maritima TaxID=126957 RepID=T1IT79_STRMM